MTEYVSASQEEESNANYPEKNKLLDGTEGTMVLEFCKKYNCTILLVEGRWCSNYYLQELGNGAVAEIFLVLHFVLCQRTERNGERFSITLREQEFWEVWQ